MTYNQWVVMSWNDDQDRPKDIVLIGVWDTEEAAQAAADRYTAAEEDDTMHFMVSPVIREGERF